MIGTYGFIIALVVSFVVTAMLMLGPESMPTRVRDWLRLILTAIAVCVILCIIATLVS